MKNLVYDNLYKFLVSLGLTLIVLPIGIYIFISTQEPILISQKDFAQLAETSKKALSQKEALYSVIFQIPLWIIILIVILGLVLLIWGFLQWRTLQNNQNKLQNKKTEAEIKKLNCEAKKMSEQEIDKKMTEAAISDLNNTQNPTDDEEELGKKESLQKSISRSIDKSHQKDAMETNLVASESENKTLTQSPSSIAQQDNEFSRSYDSIGIETWKSNYKHIHDLIFSYLEQHYGQDYTFQRDYKIDGFGYDAIGIAIKDNTDLIVEIRFFEKSISINQSRLSTALLTMQTAMSKYQTSTKRNQQGILFIVTYDEMLEFRRSRIQDHLNNIIDPSYRIEIRLMDMKTLENSI